MVANKPQDEVDKIQVLVSQMLNSDALKEFLVGFLRKELPKMVREIISADVKEEVRKAVEEIKDAAPTVQTPSFSDILKGLAAGSVSRMTTLIRREEDAREQRKDLSLIHI